MLLVAAHEVGIVSTVQHLPSVDYALKSARRDASRS